MTALQIAVSCIAVAVIALYALFGGADFGGGVWDIAAYGPRRDEQRDAIGHAIGPVWETNHVWLIFLIVLMFTCFPPVFASISVALYVPLNIVLVGIILRGAAYAFRSSAAPDTWVSQAWGHVFGIASIVAPFFFGMAVGGLAIGGFRWLSPFAFAVGFLALTLCAQVAAIFLTLETRTMLRGDFRARAGFATIALAVAGALALSIAYDTSPKFFATLVQPRAIPGILTAMALGIGILGALATRSFALARILVAGEVLGILSGWYGSQFPYMIPGVLTVADAAAPPQTLAAFLWLCGIGGAVLLPSLALLFSVFKRAPLEIDACAISPASPRP